MANNWALAQKEAFDRLGISASEMAGVYQLAGYNPFINTTGTWGITYLPETYWNANYKAVIDAKINYYALYSPDNSIVSVKSQTGGNFDGFVKDENVFEIKRAPRKIVTTVYRGEEWPVIFDPGAIGHMNAMSRQETALEVDKWLNPKR